MLKNLITRAPQQKKTEFISTNARLATTELSKTMAWVAPVINFDYNPLHFILEA